MRLMRIFELYKENLKPPMVMPSIKIKKDRIVSNLKKKVEQNKFKFELKNYNPNAAHTYSSLNKSKGSHENTLNSLVLSR